MMINDLANACIRTGMYVVSEVGNRDAGRPYRK